MRDRSHTRNKILFIERILGKIMKNDQLEYLYDQENKKVRAVLLIDKIL